MDMWLINRGGQEEKEKVRLGVEEGAREDHRRRERH